MSTGAAPATGLPPLRTVTVADQAVPARRLDGGAARVTNRRGAAADDAAASAARVNPAKTRRRTEPGTPQAALAFPRLPAEAPSRDDRADEAPGRDDCEVARFAPGVLVVDHHVAHRGDEVRQWQHVCEPLQH